MKTLLCIILFSSLSLSQAKDTFGSEVQGFSVSVGLNLLFNKMYDQQTNLPLRNTGLPIALFSAVTGELALSHNGNSNFDYFLQGALYASATYPILRAYFFNGFHGSNSDAKNIVSIFSAFEGLSLLVRDNLPENVDVGITMGSVNVQVSF